MRFNTKFQKLIIIGILFGFIGTMGFNPLGELFSKNPIQDKSNNLPFSATLSEIPYFDAINQQFNLTVEEQALLEENQFVVINRLGTDDILDAYYYYWDYDLPIFITTDTILQTWHLMLDGYMKQFEEALLYPAMKNMTMAMWQTFTQEFTYSAESEQNFVLRDIALYLSVANKICNETTPIPIDLVEDVNLIYGCVMDEATYPSSKDRLSDSPNVSRFIDDYSMYKPRGHYTESETLKTYFRLFKWLARFRCYYESFAGISVMGRDVLELTSESVHLCWLLEHTEFIFNNNTLSPFNLWQIVDQFISHLVGFGYQTIPTQIIDKCVNLKGMGWHPDDFSEADFETLRQNIVNDTTIPGEYCDPIYHAYEVPAPPVSPKLFVLFGERLTMDTEIHLDLYVNTINPDFVTGLSFAGSCLLSNRALELLPDSQTPSLSKMRNKTLNLTSNERLPVAWKQIETMAELTKPNSALMDGNATSIPEFMQKNPWMDEKLTTALGGWAQLKHDTILYAKQPTVGSWCSCPEGYVEPYPGFYVKLRGLLDTLKATFQPFEHLILKSDPDSDYQTGSEKFFEYKMVGIEYFKNQTYMLEEIVRFELTGKPLNSLQTKFIQETFDHQPCGSGMPMYSGWLPTIHTYIDYRYAVKELVINSRGTCMADIFTFANSFPSIRVLEVATGVFEHLICIAPGFNGTDICTIGPVYSYYEFLSTPDFRLNDDEWRGLLYNPAICSEKEIWGPENIQRGPWAQQYMVSIEPTQSILYNESIDTHSVPEWINEIDSSTFIQNPVYANLEYEYHGNYDENYVPYPEFDPIEPLILVDSSALNSLENKNIAYGSGWLIWLFLVIGSVFVFNIQKNRVMSENH